MESTLKNPTILNNNNNNIRRLLEWVFDTLLEKFFKKKDELLQDNKSNSQEQQAPTTPSSSSEDSGLNTQIKQEIAEIKEKFVAFIGKLEDRANEFTAEAITELQSLLKDKDEEGFNRLESSVIAQLEGIEEKSHDTFNSKVRDIESASESEDGFDDDLWDELKDKLEDECSEILSDFESIIEKKQKQIEEVRDMQDYEGQYQEVLAEFEALKPSLCCTQCNSNLEVEQIFSKTAIITCPSCSTQNTFEPGTKAMMLETLGRNLAEQRVKSMRDAQEDMAEKAEKFSSKIHGMQNDLDDIDEDEQSLIDEKMKEIKEARTKYEELRQETIELYNKYIRAMTNEWNKINPDLTESHETLHERLVLEFSRQYLARTELTDED